VNKSNRLDINTRVVSAKLDPVFHKQLRALAAEKDVTVSAVIKAALELYMQGRAH